MRCKCGESLRPRRVPARQKLSHHVRRGSDSPSAAAVLTFWVREAGARRQLLLPVSDNYFCRRRVGEGARWRPQRARVIVAGRSLAVGMRSAWSLLLITKTTMAVGAVGNGPPFSKARWARPRVHGAGSVHGLFGRAQPVEPQVVDETIVDPEASCAVGFVTRRPRLDWRRLCRGVWPARSGSWGHRTPAAPSDAPGDRSPRPSPSDRERSDPTARRSDCW